MGLRLFFVLWQVPTPARSQSLHQNHKRRRTMPKPRKWLLSKSNLEASTASGNAHRYDPPLHLSLFLLPCLHTFDTTKRFYLNVCLSCCTERGGRARRGQRFRGRKHEQRLRVGGIQQPQQPQQKEAIQEQTQEKERCVRLFFPFYSYSLLLILNIQ